MRPYHLFTLLLIFMSSCVAVAQEAVFTSRNLSINKHVDGTLLLPKATDNPPLAILIAGSGPTDRDGNQNFLKTDVLKKLAQALSERGIATFRYDKRIVKQLKKGDLDDDMLFDDFIDDAISVMQYFNNDQSPFSSYHIIGHSQGSLVGMLAAFNGADSFISLAGAGKTIDAVIVEQIEKTAPMFVEDAKKTFEILKNGQTTNDYPEALSSIFRIDIQPFMSNWMAYNPQDIISRLDIPILLINGTKDLQVPVSEAELLRSANSAAEFLIIENMNHVLVHIEGDELENSKSYSEPFRELAPELVEGIASFILKE